MPTARSTAIADRLQELLDERQCHSDALAQIDATLARVQTALMVANGTVLRKSPGRPRKIDMAAQAEFATGAENGAPATLADHLEVVMRKVATPVGIGDLLTRVKAAGYKSKSKDFRPVVSLALIKDKRFKRVGRGVYTLR